MEPRLDNGDDARGWAQLIPMTPAAMEPRLDNGDDR